MAEGLVIIVLTTDEEVDPVVAGKAMTAAFNEVTGEGVNVTSTGYYLDDIDFALVRWGVPASKRQEIRDAVRRGD